MRQEFVGLSFDSLKIKEALSFVIGRADGAEFAYVVTPNVDHVVRLHDKTTSKEVRAAYDSAGLCLCDSRVLRLLASVCGVTLQVVPGSDLTDLVLKHCLAEGDVVNLVGGDDQVGATLRSMFPHISFNQCQPPMGLLDKPDAMAEVEAFLVSNPARLSLLAIGSPQQELIAYRAMSSGKATGTALCIGASIDFITGRAARAPLMLQNAGLEWLYRLVNEPRRLWRRYLLRGPRIFSIAVSWRFKRR